MQLFLSQKFKFWSFVSMLLLVFVHGYNLNDRYLQPWSLVTEPRTINNYLQYFFANGIFRFRIPMLFIISGYLYAVHDAKPYSERIKKRFRTLVIPYFTWSAIALIFVFVLEFFPFTRNAVLSSNLMQIDDQRMLLHQYKWYEVFGRWFFSPVPYQLWFIRVLFFYNLAYPAIRWMVTRKYNWIFFVALVFAWISTAGLFFMEGEGLLFFSLGVWMQKKNFDMQERRKWLHPLPWALLFVALAAIKTSLIFVTNYQQTHSLFITVLLMHKLMIFSGLIATWFGCDAVVRCCMNRQWFVRLSAFSFFIYAMHVPLTTFAIDVMLNAMHKLPHYRLITFFLLPMIIICSCIITGWLWRKIFPKGYSFVTGGRGF